MSVVEVNLPAPDFSISDFEGNKVTLSEFKDKKNVILVLNRGFT